MYQLFARIPYIIAILENRSKDDLSDSKKTLTVGFRIRKFGCYKLTSLKNITSAFSILFIFIFIHLFIYLFIFGVWRIFSE